MSYLDIKTITFEVDERNSFLVFCRDRFFFLFILFSFFLRSITLCVSLILSFSLYLSFLLFFFFLHSRTKTRTALFVLIKYTNNFKSNFFQDITNCLYIYFIYIYLKFNSFRRSKHRSKYQDE